MIEIGPGGGVLTLELLRAGARVLAVELDANWAFELRRRVERQLEEQQGTGGALRLVVGDAMDLDWTRLGAQSPVVGNLPYGVATALLQRALAFGAEGLRLAFLVQLEVAQRICARPGDQQFGALSVLVWARTEAADGQSRLLGRVKPGSFIPPPKVDSAFVGLRLAKSPVSQACWRPFCKLVFMGFGQRRKTLRNALKGSYDSLVLDSALVAGGIDARQRAEQLNLQQWLGLFESLRGEPS